MQVIITHAVSTDPAIPPGLPGFGRANGTTQTRRFTLLSMAQTPRASVPVAIARAKDNWLASRIWLLGFGLLAACTACTADEPSDIAISVRPALSATATAPPSPASGKDVEVTFQSEGILEILTWGSSTCPYVPVELETLTDRRVRVAMQQRTAKDPKGCTKDYEPSVATLRLPAEVQSSATLRVDLIGIGPERNLAARLGHTNKG
jgi:hypothetical protein